MRMWLPWRTRSLTFLAIMRAGTLVLELIRLGITEEPTTLRPRDVNRCRLP